MPPRRKSFPILALARALGNVAAFGCGLTGLWLAGAPLFPQRPLPVLGEKRGHFLAHAAGYDAVFLGSSRVYRGIVPRVFDDEMRARGHAMRSFNFAMEAVWPPESLYRVREFLPMRAGVRWIFIELLPVNPRLTAQNARTQRSIYWHDWRHTALAWRAIASDGTLASGAKAGLFALHGELFLRRLSQLSRAASALELRLNPEAAKTAEKQSRSSLDWQAQEGFLPEPDTPMAPAMAAQWRRESAEYARSLATVPLPEFLRAELRDLAAAVRAAGATPIFFITPSTTRGENFTGLREQGIDAELISFKDPQKFPALYEPANHFDGPHLNERGARALTRLLAQEAAALFDARR